MDKPLPASSLPSMGRVRREAVGVGRAHRDRAGNPDGRRRPPAPFAPAVPRTPHPSRASGAIHPPHRGEGGAPPPPHLSSLAKGGGPGGGCRRRAPQGPPPWTISPSQGDMAVHAHVRVSDKGPVACLGTFSSLRRKTGARGRCHAAASGAAFNFCPKTLERRIAAPSIEEYPPAQLCLRGVASRLQV
jgi:hypothetical protein